MRSQRLFVALLAAVSLAGACSFAEGATAPPASIPAAARTLLYLAPAPEHDPAYLPAFRGAEVAAAIAELRGAAVSVVWVDISPSATGSPIPAGDAAIVAPGTPPRLLARLWGHLDMPVVSLAGTGPAGWWVLGPDSADLAAGLLRIAGERPCAVSDVRTPHPRLPRDAAIRRIRSDIAIAGVRALADCSAIVWTGTPEGAAALRVAVSAGGLRSIPFIGTDLLRGGSYETAVGRAGRGTLVVSGAADLGTRLDLRSRRFVQRYQAEVGLPPAPFSAEGFDAARLLIEALATGRRPEVYGGISGRLARGEQAGPSLAVFRLGAARWRPED